MPWVCCAAPLFDRCLCHGRKTSRDSVLSPWREESITVHQEVELKVLLVLLQTIVQHEHRLDTLLHPFEQDVHVPVPLRTLPGKCPRSAYVLNELLKRLEAHHRDVRVSAVIHKAIEVHEEGPENLKLIRTSAAIVPSYTASAMPR